MPKYNAFTYRAADEYPKAALEIREKLRRQQDLANWHPTHKASYDSMGARSQPVGKAADATIRNGKVVDSKPVSNEGDAAATARCHHRPPPPAVLVVTDCARDWQSDVDEGALSN